MEMELAYQLTKHAFNISWELKVLPKKTVVKVEALALQKFSNWTTNAP